MDDETYNISLLLSKFEMYKEFFNFITSKYPLLKHQFFNYYFRNKFNNEEFHNNLWNNRNNFFSFDNYLCDESCPVSNMDISKEYRLPASSMTSDTYNNNATQCLCHSPCFSNGENYIISNPNIFNPIEISKSSFNMNSTCSDGKIAQATASTSNTPPRKIPKKNRGGNVIGKRRPNHPPEVIKILKGWFKSKEAYPYPTNQEKFELCKSTGLSLVNNWFINARKRYLKFK
ncbi:hypothetical protein U3516DRAFT_529879 [Neocallimastix sp. 'constans']